MKRKKKDLKTPAVLILILTLIALAFFFKQEKTSFVSNFTFEKKSGIFLDYEISRYYSSAKIFNPKTQNISLGFVTDPFNLKFGEIPGGGSYGKRYINLENLKDRRVKIEIKTYGNISEKVFVKENNFFLQPRESKKVEIYFFTNQTLEGFYEGEIDVIVKIPKYDFLYVFEKFW